MNIKSGSIGNSMINMVLDPSHDGWVLGGIFRDFHRKKPDVFEKNPVFLPAPNSPSNIFKWFTRCLKIRKSKLILFSSLTPFENYLKFPSRKKKQLFGLWYTHKEADFEFFEKRALRRADIIFLHSFRESDQLKKFTDARLIKVIGGIDEKLFEQPARKAEKIVWVGTPVSRKRPELILEVAKKTPSLDFRVIGKGWKESKFWSALNELENVEYMELDGPLSSTWLDGCSIYLMTSRVEGGPMPLLETLAAGLFPIATRTGFVEDLFELAGVPSSFILDDCGARDFMDAIFSARDLLATGFEVNAKNVRDLNLNRISSMISSNFRDLERVRRTELTTN
jgi:glycosyltransferase involved in cell wall biosynthesis